ncbi:MAG: hypothetical protein Q8M73_09520 [Actinomycetota bacterium]|nr:hypothetical protein [Actinomycetota bacterium]
MSEARVELDEMLDEWVIHLCAEGKSAQTVKTYSDGVRGFIDWSALEGIPNDLNAATSQPLRQCTQGPWQLQYHHCQPPTLTSSLEQVGRR